MNFLFFCMYLCLCMYVYACAHVCMYVFLWVSKIGNAHKLDGNM